MESKKQILWVDDEIEFLRAHIMYLEEHNYEVTRSTNGDDALALIRERPFDLVFLDEQMPGKDGLTTLEEIKKLRSLLPVVMVTKSEEERLMEDALGRNIDGYLVKPVNPSQILSVCKSLLHVRTIKKTHITTEYVRKYAEYKARLMTNQSPQDWSSLYQSLCSWDVNLEMMRDQGLEDTHQNHKREVSRKFLRYLEDNYVEWALGRAKNPLLVTETVKRRILPLLREGKKTCLFLLSGFRLDQWLSVREHLESRCRLQESWAWAMLPTERSYCRTALLTGKHSRELSISQPQLWDWIRDDEHHSEHEPELLRQQLYEHGLHDLPPPPFHAIRSVDQAQALLEQLPSLVAPLEVVTVEFLDMLGDIRTESGLLQELAPDEAGFRQFLHMWFGSSSLLRLLTGLTAAGYTVVLSSDHGSILAREPVEVFCQEEKSPHPRVKTGQDISCDERYAHFIESPRSYNLPGEDGSLAYVLAKENRYFIYPNKYQYSFTQFKDRMVSGGLSMEEVILPLVVLSPHA